MIKQLLCLALVCAAIQNSDSVELNNRPIVGVLFQERFDNVTEYAASSYVKWLEMAGARVVPIFIRRNRAYYESLMNQINGVVMPGGATALLHSGYSEAADLILDIALAKNEAGIYFPVWGTCLGFEKLATYFTGNSEKWKSNCEVEDVMLALDFPPGVQVERSFRMFQNAGGAIAKLLAKYPLTPNYHHFCLRADTFAANKNLTDQFTLVSTNTYGGVKFVSTLEHKKYPIYGTQWHPEKAQFEWNPFKHIAHDLNAIQVGQYFGNFLVNETRKNSQHFANKTEEAEALIYNYSHALMYHGLTNQGPFTETYVVKIKPGASHSIDAM